MKHTCVLFLALISMIGCPDSVDTNATEEADFFAPGFGDVSPWTSDAFDAAESKFTFAIHSDLTGGERDDVYEVAIAQLNLLRPEFIISVGDLIEGDTDESIVDQQWDSFDERAGRANAPVFYVAGNHDRTGQLMQDVWDRRQGRGYYHFRYKDVLFLMLDTEDNTPERMQQMVAVRTEALRILDEQGRNAYNETEHVRMPEYLAGNITAAQSRYVIEALRANEDVRWTFLFMHKTPWLRDDLTAFTDIEDALAERPYTVFHGHFHAFAYTKRRGRDYVRLSTTGGAFVPQSGRSVDHVTLVTVDDEGVDIANLLLEGILDKTGHIPLNGEELCFESTRCAESQ